MKLDLLPFHIGAHSSACNPGNIPNALPFVLNYDPSRGVLVQDVTPHIEEVLESAYRLGVSFGTPLDDDSFGKPYADDFLDFIVRNCPNVGRALEIGAGHGYVTERLCELGYATVGIEPGRGYKRERRAAEIVEDFFPSDRVQGSFDLIAFYGVLEHVVRPVDFLNSVRNQLATGGRVVLSVPDCTAEIVAGDPGMLLHEHISYFDAGSLSRLLESVGFNAIVTKSGYGRCLYAVAALDGLPTHGGVTQVPVDIVAAYPEACSAFIARCAASIEQLLAQGSVGIFCPGRGLAILNHTWPLRFFDDDPALHGKFLPPYQHRIESRASLLSNPVQSLVVLSRTFGKNIRGSLRESGYEGEIVTVDELVDLASH